MTDNAIKVLDKGFVRLVDSMGDDSSIVQAARVSYGKGTKKISEDEGLIRYLIRHKHTTPLEMVQFKFHIKAPIFVIRQWHRHRTWSFNENSGRYSEMPDETYVPEDKHFTKQNPLNKQGGTDEVITIHTAPNRDDYVEYDMLIDHLDNWSWADVFEQEQKMNREYYKKYLGTGVRRELARINLPLAQYSEMYACVDLHNLFHFLKLRLDSHAQYEIRVYAEAIADLIKTKVPVAYKAFEDYVLGSTQFTALEQETMAELIDLVKNSVPNGDGWWEPHMNALIVEYTKRNIRNKREQDECIQKLSKIFLYRR